MNFFENILNTALLGTEKKQLISSELSTELADLYDQLQGNKELDNEEKFLQIAALGSNYRKCGMVPVKLENLQENSAPEEDKSYCSESAINVLKDILEEDSDALLKIWLEKCIGKGYVVAPQMVTVLIDNAARSKANRTLIVQCCGKRGAWLIHLNKDWQFLANSESDERVWETGTAEQRRNFLLETRKRDPAMAREMLIATWAVENANIRAELLKQLEANISDEDIEWLETLLNEKSQKVKDEAMRLLKMLPGSNILKLYLQIIQEAVQLKKEKGFLGIGSKLALHIQLPVIAEDTVFKSGIDKLSKDKKVADDDYVLLQLISEVLPKMWEEHFNTSPENIISYFEKEEKTKQFLVSIAVATLKFKDSNWALEFANHCSVFFGDLIPLLPIKKQEEYIIKHLTAAHDILDCALKMKQEWSILFAKKVITYAEAGIAQWLNGQYNFSTNYKYNNKSFYKSNIQMIPVGLLPYLNSRPQNGAEMEEYKWEENTGYLIKLITLKQNIYKSFA